MPISAPTLAQLDANLHASTVYLNSWKLTTVATAKINQATFPTVVYELTVDTTSADWLNTKVGQRVVITRAGARVAEGVIRKAVTSTILYIDARINGDSGSTQEIAYTFANNDDITVYNDYPHWSLFSVIRSGLFYKSYDLVYSNQGTTPQPVARLGKWRRADADPTTNKASLTFSTDGSFDWRGTACTRTYEALPTGATLTAGSLASAAVNSNDITVEFDPGFYLIACTVSNGTTSQRAVRPVWINTPTGATAPLSFSTACIIESDEQTELGRDMTVRMYGALADTDAPKYGYFMLSEIATFDGVVIDSDADFVDSYVGIAETVARESNENGINTLTLNLKSPNGILQKIGCAPQAVIEAASPANWTEVLTGLATPSFVIWYLIQYHCPNALMLFDYYPADAGVSDPARRTQWTTSATTLGAQVTETAQYLAGAFGSASDGSYYFRRDPVIENTTFRTALDEKMTFTESRVMAPLSYTENTRPETGWLQLDGWVTNSNAVNALRSIWGKSAQGQGPNKTQGNVVCVQTQTELNEKSGNMVARDNNPTPELTFKPFRNIDVFDVIRDRNVWGRLQIAAGYDARGEAKNRRFIVRSIQREWRNVEDGSLNKYVTLVVSPETSGVPGETEIIIPASFPSFDITYPPTDFPGGVDPFLPGPQPPYTGAEILPENLWGFAKEEVSGETVIVRVNFSATTGSAVVTEVQDGTITGRGMWGCSDPWNYHTKFILTDEGLWKINDIKSTAPITGILVKDNAGIFGNSARVGSRVMMSINRRGFIGISSGYNMYARSFDYGNTWTVSNINAAADAYGDSTWADDTGGIYQFSVMMAERRAGHIFACQMENNTPGNMRLHVSADYGASWSDSLLATGSFFSPVGLYVPYTRYDGTPNLVGSGTTGTQLYYYGSGVFVRAIFDNTSLASAVNVAFADSSVYVGSRQVCSVHIDTGTGTIINSTKSVAGAGATNSRVIAGTISSTGTVTWNTSTQFGAGNRNSSVFGYSTWSKQFVLAWSRDSAGVSFNGDAGFTAVSADGGANFVSLSIPNFPSGRVGYLEPELSDVQ